MRFFLLALALVPSAAAIAAPCFFPDLPPITWQPYREARAALLDAGFEPVAQNGTPTNSAETAATLAGWYELKACAGTGAAPCRFEWQDKHGTPFAIITTRAKVTRTLCD